MKRSKFNALPIFGGRGLLDRKEASAGFVSSRTSERGSEA